MLFSIIVPVYNTKPKYIDKCINSLVNMNSSSEVIIINDGSDDIDTLKCLQDLEIKFNKKIIIINTKNKGVSNARNIGIDAATGDYILFVDSDDFLEDNCIKTLSNVVHNQDIVFFQHKLFIDDKSIIVNNDDSMKYENISSKDEIISEIINPHNITKNVNYGTPWAKIFKREFLKENNLKYDICLPRTQDRVFLYDCVTIAQDIGLYSYSGYIYNSNEYSVCKKYNVNLYDKFKRVYNCMKLRTRGTKFENDVEIMYINFFFEVLMLDIFHKDHDIRWGDRVNEANKLYNLEYKNIFKKITMDSKLTIKRKIFCFMFGYHLNILVYLLFYYKNFHK